MKNGAEVLEGLTSINDLVEPLLTDETLEKINARRVLQTVVPGDYQVKYLGVSDLDEASAVVKLAEAVNKTCRDYDVIGRLGDPIKYELTNGKALYLFYLAFTEESAEEFQNKVIEGSK